MNLFAVRLNADSRQGQAFSAYPTVDQYRKIHDSSVGDGFEEAVNFLPECGIIRGYLPPRHSKEIQGSSAFSLITMTYSGDKHLPNAIVGIQLGCRYVGQNQRSNPNGHSLQWNYTCDENSSFLLDEPLCGAYDILFGGVKKWVRGPTKRIDEDNFRVFMKELSKSENNIQTYENLIRVINGFCDEMRFDVGAGNVDIDVNVIGSDSPKKYSVTTMAYARDPRVVYLALKRANGICEDCNMAAPFIRRSDSLPYLEVHHKITLSNGGPDILENAIALCPNCHRKRHFG